MYIFTYRFNNLMFSDLNKANPNFWVAYFIRFECYAQFCDANQLSDDN